MRTFFCLLLCLTNVFLKADEIDSLMQNALEAFHVPGAAVGIVKEGKIHLIKTYGELVTEKTSFSLGALENSFTTLLIGQFVDEGILSWDDDLNKFFPDFEPKITIRQLLTHRSGIPRQEARFNHLSEICPLEGLKGRFLYNEANDTILKLLVEKVSENSYALEVEKRLLNPLKISSSSNSLSIQEMSHWLQLQLSEGNIDDQQLIKKETLQETQTLQVLVKGSSASVGNYLGYALGWYFHRFREHDVFFCHAEGEGYSHYMALLPEQKSGVVVLSNSSHPMIYFVRSVTHTLLDNLLGETAFDWITMYKEAFDRVVAEQQSESSSVKWR